MKFHSSNPMTEHTAELNKLADRLGTARAEFLAKEGERKHFISRIRDKMPGKSFAERQGQAEGTQEALEFMTAHARLRAVYEYLVDKFEIARSDWNSWYLTHKQDHDMIKKEQQ